MNSSDQETILPAGLKKRVEPQIRDLSKAAEKLQQDPSADHEKISPAFDELNGLSLQHNHERAQEQENSADFGTMADPKAQLSSGLGENREAFNGQEDLFAKDPNFLSGDKAGLGKAANGTVVPQYKDDEVPNMPGAILCHARELLGLTQSDIAARLKLRVNTISDIEHDRLNQMTAAPFVRGHLENYAKLVNIDPKVVLDLYNQNVAELSEKIHLSSENRHNSTLKWLVYGFIFAAIAVGLAINFLINEPAEDYENEPLVIEEPAPMQEQEFVFEGYLQEPSSQGGVSLAGKGAALVVVDENTQRAQAQAEALGNNDPVMEEDPQPKAVHALTVEGHAASVNPADTAGDIEVPAPDVNAREQIVVNGKELPAAASNSLSSQQDSTVVSSRGEPKAAEQDPPLNTNEAAAVLDDVLVDISPRARLEGREGLASMNQAVIEFLSEAAIRVTDSRGKILAEGSYQKGAAVKVTGIPPLNVSVSDTTAVSVSYMGGRIIVPSARQVTFDLPADERR